ncbi:FAD/NAD(P)-binding protein [Streptomyces sp. NPDC020917]|uniref:FAD/NAD(P)-binding protein n=1 Tax=Streptomyces sp. NPDC020917 TaxID=3365102 RepID=UPI0037908682
MTTTHRTVCVIGAGPRGLSVVERLCANARELPEGGTVHVHVVDPYPPGAGRVWRTDQSRQLLMNTVAGQISVFTDASVDLAGPLEPGPSLHQWSQALLAGEFGGGHPAHLLEEARALGPDTYPTRGFYGHYLQWAWHRIVQGAPEPVTVEWHRARAIALDDEKVLDPAAGPGADPGSSGPRQQVTLSDGAVLGGLDAVVLCQGHLPAGPAAAEREFVARVRQVGLAYIGPANPADVDLEVLPAGGRVLLRGLGLNFFDYMAQLTAGRGGTFTRVLGELVYRPSGREPVLFAGSRRGVPYQARGENEKGPHGRHEPVVFTAERVAELRAAHPQGLDFRSQLWPLIAREVETVYYRTLLSSRGHVTRAAQLEREYLAAGYGPGEVDPVLGSFGIGEKYRLDWELLARPYRDRDFVSVRDFTNWLLDYLREDVAEAGAGNVSGPLKAALDVLRDLRNEVRLAVDHGGLHGESYRRDLDGWYTPLNAFLSIGPPARRVEEMIALIEAGVLHIIGPDLQVHAEEGGYRVRSPLVPGSGVVVDALVEARLPEISVARTGDALLRHLLDSGQAARYRIRSRSGGVLVTDGLAVTGRPFHVVDAGGRAHPRRHAFGVPTESVHWVTAAGIRPGVNSVTLTDSDAIARAALGHPADEHPDHPADEHRVPLDPPAPASPGGAAPATSQGPSHVH